MEVSIVIVNYNGKNMLKGTLESINKIISINHTNKTGKKNYEIMVVDNNSTDGSVGFVKKNYPDVEIIHNKKNLGYSGINSALPHCNGKYILFLNNDIEVGNGCIKELTRVMESDDEIAMTAPKLVNYYDKKLKSGGTWVSRSFYNGHIADTDEIKEIPYLGVGLIRKSIVDKFNYLFDNDYFIYAEDLDLGLRLRLIGYKVVFVPKAILYHRHAATTKKFNSAFTTFLLERNLLTTFLKILSLKNIILFLPYVFLIRVFAVTRDVITFRFANAFSRLKAIFWILFNFKLIYEKRKKLQKLRVADDKFILKIFSEKYIFEQPILV